MNFVHEFADHESCLHAYLCVQVYRSPILVPRLPPPPEMTSRMAYNVTGQFILHGHKLAHIDRAHLCI